MERSWAAEWWQSEGAGVVDGMGASDDFTRRRRPGGRLRQVQVPGSRLARLPPAFQKPCPPLPA